MKTTVKIANRKATAILAIIEEEKRKMTETLKWCDDTLCGKNIQIAELEAHLKKTQLDGLKMIDKIAGLEGDVKDLRDALEFPLIKEANTLDGEHNV